MPKQDLCPTQYGCPASMESYTITMIRKNSLFIKLFKIKTSSKSLFEQFMPLVRPELETCPVCGSSGNLHVHCYYKRYLIDFIGGKSVRHDVTVLRCTCDSCGSTHAILPDFIILTVPTVCSLSSASLVNISCTCIRSRNCANVFPLLPDSSINGWIYGKSTNPGGLDS